MENFSNRHRNRNTEVGTDIPCVWDKARKTSEPSVINDIKIRNTQNQPVEPSTVFYTPSKKLNISKHEIEKRVYNLCRNNNGVFLHTLDNSSDESEEENENYPLSLEKLAKQYNNFSDSNIEFHDYLESYHSEEINKTIEEITRGQTDNEQWFTYRKGRITASNFHSVLHYKFGDNDNNYIMKRVFQECRELNTEAVEYGRVHEPIARHQYFETYKKNHKCAKLKQTGLYVMKSKPYMGASPDGVISCKCCGIGLVEIKCSYSCRSMTPEQVCEKKSQYHLYLDANHNVRLKRDSSWYTQIQGQMGVCDTDWCDFVFFTDEALFVERINFDIDHFQEIVGKCDDFFQKYIKKNLC